MAKRKYAFAKVGLYPIDGGDPIITDKGLGWWENLTDENNAFQGTPTYGALGTVEQGQPLAELIPGLGITSRMFQKQQDTRLIHFNFSSGSWDERRPAFGIRKYFIRQYDSGPGVQYLAESKNALPENPNFAFNIAIGESPFDWDHTLFPVYHRVEFGNFGIHFQDGSIKLVEWTGGQWAEQIELSCPTNRTDNGLDITVWIRCHGGKLLVSTDFGKHYEELKEKAAGASVVVNSGTLVLRGQGGSIAFRADQLKPYTTRFRTANRNTYTPRTSPSPSMTGHYDSPYGSTVAFTDRSDPSTGKVSVEATLTPRALTGGFGWSFYAVPILYSTSFLYPVTIYQNLQAASFPWDSAIVEVSIDKPRELHAASATIHLNYDAFGAQLIGNTSYDRRKLYIQLGYTLDDATTESLVTFTGYIRDITEGRSSWGLKTAMLAVDSVSVILKEQEWDPFDVIPLPEIGTLNQINDYILTSVGFGGTLGLQLPNYRTWHVAGDTYSLDRGIPGKPFELVKARETKWATLERINRYRQLEVGTSDDGKLFTIPMDPDYTTGTVHSLYMDSSTGETDIRRLIKGIDYKKDTAETCSCVMVYSTDYNGSPIMGFAVDNYAESPTVGPAFGRFKPWRVTYQEDIEGPTIPEICTLRAQSIADRKFRYGFEPAVTIPVDPRIGRFDEVKLYGVNSPNVPDGMRFKVVSERHNYKARTALGELETTLGLKVINYGIPDP